MSENEVKEHDVEGLLRKNAELLGEVKALKARIAELEGERDTAQGEAQQAQETMRRVQLEEPLERTLSGAFMLPWRLVRPLLDEHFSIELGEEGKLSVTAKESGEAVALDDMTRQAMTIPDLAAALRPISGPDVPGSNRKSPSKPGTEGASKVARPFGLR